MGLITNIEDLNPVIQEKIKNALKTQIEAQALDVYNNLPDKYNDYLKTEIEKAENSMLKMIEESRLNGAILPNISEIFVWNKERKRCLEKLLEESGENAQQPQKKQPKTEQETTPSRRKGRPNEQLKDKMIDDDSGRKLQKIHTKIRGKKGKDVALIILACIKKGWMTRPTYTQVKNEFGDIGSKTGYNKYLNGQMFTKEEIEGAINSLD